MVTEVTMFDQTMEKINSLITYVQEYKEENDAWLQGHEEAFTQLVPEDTHIKGIM